MNLQGNDKVYAVTWRKRTPLVVFFRPESIILNASGVNIGNEALLFHEALHGFVGRLDYELQQDLHAPGKSCELSTYIKTHVLTGAPLLDTTDTYECTP